MQSGGRGAMWRCARGGTERPARTTARRLRTRQRRSCPPRPHAGCQLLLWGEAPGGADRRDGDARRQDEGPRGGGRVPETGSQPRWPASQPGSWSPAFAAVPDATSVRLVVDIGNVPGDVERHTVDERSAGSHPAGARTSGSCGRRRGVLGTPRRHGRCAARRHATAGRAQHRLRSRRTGARPD